MAIKYLDGKRLSRVLIAGSKWLEKHQDILNELNVYPVPDGDTGTNMALTIGEIDKVLNKSDVNFDIAEISKLVSENILLNARGNSGTILSQIISGILLGLKGKEKIYVRDIVEALKNAKEMAYKAVSNPVEGTILTVIRKISEEAEVISQTEEYLDEMLIKLKDVALKEVERTQEILPKLKEAGVVDAGAKGLYYFFEGFYILISNQEFLDEIKNTYYNTNEKFVIIDEEIDYDNRYCTEFIIDNAKCDLEELKSRIENIGTSIVAVQSATKTKIHIHTNNPGKVLEIAINYGELEKIKIENMVVMQEDLKAKQNNDKDVIYNKNDITGTKYIAIADTKEIADMFIKKGVAAVVIGGQSKNPSVSQLVEVIKKVGSNNIIILPNNKNIIGTANAAKNMFETNIIVLETKSVLEGYFVANNRTEEFGNVVNRMKENISIEITKAVKKINTNGLEINKGDYLLIKNGEIINNFEKIENLKQKLIDEVKDEYVISVKLIIGKEKDFENIKRVLIKYTDVDIDEQIGEQENYPLYMYVEKKDRSIGDIAILTDSTADLTNDMIEGLPIFVVPLSVKFENENRTYKEGVDLSKELFWKKLVSENNNIKTSQPSPADFYDMYKKIFKLGYKEIISLHISSKLSGTINSAKTAKNMLRQGEKIDIIDTGNVSLGLGRLVREAAIMAKAHKTAKDISEWIRQVKSKSKIYFVVKELKYLERGGRIGRASSVIGGMLNLRPILGFKNGEVYLEKKAIGDRGAIKYIEKTLKSDAKENSIIVYYLTSANDNKKEINELIKVSERDSRIKIMGSFEIGAVIGAHTGPVYGVIIWPKVN